MRTEARGEGRGCNPVGARTASLGGRLRVPLAIVIFVLALAAMYWVYVRIRASIADDTIGFDFAGTVWDGATAIREGRSPYPRPTESEVQIGNPALYPPLLMLVVAPLTVLPWSLGLALWITALSAGFALALWALGVRDLRCYAVAFISAPVFGDLMTGNATLLLVPLVALAWRWRERWLRCGAAAGLAISSKFLVWPLLFWLVGTRRPRCRCSAGSDRPRPPRPVGHDRLRRAYGVPGSPPDRIRDLRRAQLLGEYDRERARRRHRPRDPRRLRHRVRDRRTCVGRGTAGARPGVGLARRAGRDSRLADRVGDNYALLFVPIAILRPRFSALWVVPLLVYWTHKLPRPRLLSSELEPGGSACCRPDDVPLVAWVFSHAPPGLWPALGNAAIAIAVVLVVAFASRTDRRARARARIRSSRRGQEPDDDLVAARVLLESVTPDSGTVHAGWLGGRDDPGLRDDHDRLGGRARDG